MNALLSINPRHVEAILSGRKLYELRKAIFRRARPKIVYMYSTSPMKKIVGEFVPGEIIADSPERLWVQLGHMSGLERDEFFSYFAGVRKGFAIEIKRVQRFEDPIDPFEMMPNFRPPQSFCYIDHLLR